LPESPLQAGNATAAPRTSAESDIRVAVCEPEGQETRAFIGEADGMRSRRAFKVPPAGALRQLGAAARAVAPPTQRARSSSKIHQRA
jgi:hypothetical protein